MSEKIRSGFKQDGSPLHYTRILERAIAAPRDREFLELKGWLSGD